MLHLWLKCGFISLTRWDRNLEVPYMPYSSRTYSWVFHLSDWSLQKTSLSFTTLRLVTSTVLLMTWRNRLNESMWAPSTAACFFTWSTLLELPLSRALVYTAAWCMVHCLAGEQIKTIFKSPFLDSNLLTTLSFENTDSLSGLNALHIISIFILLYYKICNLVKIMHCLSADDCLLGRDWYSCPVSLATPDDKRWRFPVNCIQLLQYPWLSWQTSGSCEQMWSIWYSVFSGCVCLCILIFCK